MSKKLKMAASVGILLLLSGWAVPSIGSMITGPFWHFRNSVRLETVVAHGTSQMTTFFATERTQAEAVEYLEANGMRCKVMSPSDIGRYSDPSLTAAVSCGHDFGLLFGFGSRWYAVAMINSRQKVASFSTAAVCSICP